MRIVNGHKNCFISAAYQTKSPVIIGLIASSRVTHGDGVRNLPGKNSSSQPIFTSARRHRTALISRLQSSSRRLAHLFWEGCACAKTLLLRTDVRRWRRNAHETPPWDERNKLIAALIPAKCSVLDIGCGAQTLRRHLQPTCEYQPCDIVKSSADVIQCDFNSSIYPQVTKQYDFVICSGVMEYIHDPRDFLTRVSRLGRNVILSYAVARPTEARWQRLTQGWVNHLTQPQLENMLGELHLNWSQVSTWKNQLIYTIALGEPQAASPSPITR